MDAVESGRRRRWMSWANVFVMRARYCGDFWQINRVVSEWRPEIIITFIYHIYGSGNPTSFGPVSPITEHAHTALLYTQAHRGGQ